MTKLSCFGYEGYIIFKFINLELVKKNIDLQNIENL